MNKTDFSYNIFDLYSGKLYTKCNPDIWEKEIANLAFENRLKVMFKWHVNYATSVKIRQPIIENKYKVTKAQISKAYSKIKGQL